MVVVLVCPELLPPLELLPEPDPDALPELLPEPPLEPPPEAVDDVLAEPLPPLAPPEDPDDDDCELLLAVDAARYITDRTSSSIRRNTARASMARSTSACPADE